METKPVLVERRAGYRVITLNRPHRLNAFTEPMHQALKQALAEMVDWIGRQSPGSDTEALRQLRAAFPDSPLTLRVAALSRLFFRPGGDTGPIPR